jgi:hypothetical protein
MEENKAQVLEGAFLSRPTGRTASTRLAEW